MLMMMMMKGRHCYQWLGIWD